MMKELKVDPLIIDLITSAMLEKLHKKSNIHYFRKGGLIYAK